MCEWKEINGLNNSESLFLIWYVPTNPQTKRIIHKMRPPKGATHFMEVSSPDGDVNFKKPVSQRNKDLVRFIKNGNTYVSAAKKFSISVTAARAAYLRFKDRV